MWCDNPFSQRNGTTERKEGNSLWVGCEFGLFPSGFFLAISTTLSFQTKKLNSKYFIHMGLCGPKVSTKVSTISFIISNITVLVSHNAICCGYFIPMSHGVNKKAPPIVSLTDLPAFHQVCLLLYKKKYFINLVFF